MSTTTTKHGLPAPEATDTPAGHTQIKALADALDAIIATAPSGAYADRPAFGTSGRFYRQTDTAGGNDAGTIHFDTGAAWVAVNPVGAAAGTGSLRKLGDSALEAAAGDDSRLLAGATAVKKPARAVGLSNVVTTNPGTMTYGGIVCIEGDRILLTAQSSTAQNGLWVVGANSTAALTRPVDYDTGAVVRGGCMVVVEESTTAAYADSLWNITTNGDITVGTTAHTWAILGGMKTDVIATITALHSYERPPVPLITSYGAGGTHAIATTYRPILYGSSTGHAWTLPSAAATGGNPITIINAGTANATVTTDLTDVIDATGVTSITIPPRSSVTLLPVTGGSNVWRILSVGGEAMLRPQVQVFTASGTIVGSGGGELVTFAGAAAQTLTMPAAVVGLAREIRNIDTADAVTIARAGADVFGAAGTSLKVGPGQKVRVVCAVAGAWMVLRENGEQVADGYAQVSAAAGPGDVMSMTVNGEDGVTPMRVEFACRFISNNTAAASVIVSIRDGATGGGTLFGEQLCTENTANYGMTFALRDVIIPPFTGVKTIYLNLSATAGTPTLDASAGARAKLRATWAPGAINA